MERKRPSPSPEPGRHPAPGEAGHDSLQGIKVVKEWPIDGLGTFYEQLEKEASSEEAIERLRRHATDMRLPLPAGRGTSEGFAWLLDILKRRRLIRDWGEYPAAVEWLSLHVPPGGAASFAIENRSQQKSGVTLKLLGAGIGSGRGIMLSVNQNFLERKHCARLIQHVTVRVRTFDIGRGPESPEIEPSVTAVRHLEVRTWDTCPVCGRSPDDLDPFTYVQAGPGLDLRQDDVGQKRSEIVQLSVNHRGEIELQVPIPGLGGSGNIGLFAERDIELTCSADYTFPPKVFFTPYRVAGVQVDLPFWAVR
ncbi:MAG: hypothetical protein LUQ67_07215 [Methanomicrobiales archaeon]|nr:hypothetical protein [Methanomicrobiales archaeon]